MQGKNQVAHTNAAKYIVTWTSLTSLRKICESEQVIIDTRWESTNDGYLLGFRALELHLGKSAVSISFDSIIVGSQFCTNVVANP